MMNKIFAILIIFLVSIPTSARVLELSSAGQTQEQAVYAEVYRPSKLIIGQSTAFIIKAPPDSNVRLLVAADEQGKDIFAAIDGRVGEKGITEIQLELPEKEELINKVVFFDVIVWKNQDLSDLHSARIIGIDGMNTASNAIIIKPKPSTKILPGVGTTLPGVGDISRAMDAMKDGADYTEDVYIHNKPLMLRNLRAPDVQNENEE